MGKFLAFTVALATLISVDMGVNAHGRLVAFVVLVTIGWFLSLLIAPYRKCPECGGIGWKGGLLGGERPCGRCATSGRIKRIGAS
jgi:hypothetical protein